MDQLVYQFKGESSLIKGSNDTAVKTKSGGYEKSTQVPLPIKIRLDLRMQGFAIKKVPLTYRINAYTRQSKTWLVQLIERFTCHSTRDWKKATQHNRPKPFSVQNIKRHPPKGKSGLIKGWMDSPRIHMPNSMNNKMVAKDE